MALSEADRAYFRTQLGTTIDETDLLSRLGRLLTNDAVAVEVLQERLATLLAAPLAFTIPGEYQADNKTNVTELQKKINDLLSGEGLGPSIVVIVPVESEDSVYIPNYDIERNLTLGR